MFRHRPWWPHRVVARPYPASTILDLNLTNLSVINITTTSAQLQLDYTVVAGTPNENLKLYFAIYPWTTGRPSWAAINLGNGQEGWPGTPVSWGHIDNPPSVTTVDYEPTVTWNNPLFPGTGYKIWVTWFDDHFDSNPVGSSTFYTIYRPGIILIDGGLTMKSGTVPVSTDYRMVLIDGLKHASSSAYSSIVDSSRTFLDDGKVYHEPITDLMLLSLPTYVPGSITTTSARGRVNANKI